MLHRLARRSSFRAAALPSGVKRRGGGSPGSGSPAPASPAPNASKLFRPGELDFPPAPLKESAGEAIYIYDDSQYWSVGLMDFLCSWPTSLPRVCAADACRPDPVLAGDKLLHRV